LFQEVDPGEGEGGHSNEDKPDAEEEDVLIIESLDLDEVISGSSSLQQLDGGGSYHKGAWRGTVVAVKDIPLMSISMGEEALAAGSREQLCSQSPTLPTPTSTTPTYHNLTLAV
jgi:hypothetical protein